MQETFHRPDTGPELDFTPIPRSPFLNIFCIETLPLQPLLPSRSPEALLVVGWEQGEIPALLLIMQKSPVLRGRHQEGRFDQACTLSAVDQGTPKRYFKLRHCSTFIFFHMFPLRRF